MRRTVIIYSLAMAVLIGLLKLVEYKYFVRDIPLEFYIGLVAVMFTALGIWAGLRLTKPKIVKVLPAFELDRANLEKTGISKREYEVLELISGACRTRRSRKAFRFNKYGQNMFRTSSANSIGAHAGIKRAKELHIIP
jgi:hypothetical protein